MDDHKLAQIKSRLVKVEADIASANAAIAPLEKKRDAAWKRREKLVQQLDDLYADDLEWMVNHPSAWKQLGDYLVKRQGTRHDYEGLTRSGQANLEDGPQQCFDLRIKTIAQIGPAKEILLEILPMLRLWPASGWDRPHIQFGVASSDAGIDVACWDGTTWFKSFWSYGRMRSATQVKDLDTIMEWAFAKNMEMDGE